MRSPNNATMTRRPSCWALAAALLAGASAANGFAQMQVQSGHALDASLEIGSNGYNYGRSGGATPLGYTSYQGGYGQGYGRSYLVTPQMTGAGRQYSPYTGGIEPDQRRTNYDTYLNDKQYSAGWQQKGNSYSSYSGPPGGSSRQSTNAGAYKINGRITQ